MLRLLLPVLAVTGLAVISSAREAGAGADLPSNARLRVGVQFRPEACESRSRGGDVVKISFTAFKYADGEEFENSKTQEPFEFTLGTGQVIRGLDAGLQGMCRGERRRVTIPAGLGYGARGVGQVPPGATLVYDVELLDLARKDGS